MKPETTTTKKMWSVNGKKGSLNNSRYKTIGLYVRSFQNSRILSKFSKSCLNRSCARKQIPKEVIIETQELCTFGFKHNSQLLWPRSFHALLWPRALHIVNGNNIFFIICCMQMYHKAVNLSSKKYYILNHTNYLHTTFLL